MRHLQFFVCAVLAALMSVISIVPPSQAAAANNYVAAFKGPKFDVKAYGAKGDNSTNDAVAIQAAIDAAQASGGTVVFPSGTYLVNSQITLSSTAISIEGSNFIDTVVKANAPMVSVFGFADAGQNSRFGFKNIGISGNSNAQYGIKSATINHALFYRVRVVGTTTAAFSVGYGWDNDIVECEAYGNTGDGIELIVNNNNAVNILNTKIFSNTGWGIKFVGGFGVNIQGCTIEMNRKGGIYVVLGMVGGRIAGNYFEGNAQDGYAFTTPAVTVKADIVFNGSSNAATMSSAFPSEGVQVSGNFFSHAYAEEAIRIIGVNGLTINNNARYTSSAVNSDLSAVYCDSTYSQPRYVEFKGNRGWNAFECDAENILTSRPMYFSTWKSDQVNSQNYITDDFGRYAAVAGGGGTIARSSTKYNGFDVFELTGATSTDSHGVTLDVANYPELAGKPVYMACYAKTSATDSASVVYVNGFPNTTTANSTTNWRLVEMQTVMPASGSVTFQFRKLNGDSGTVAYFTKPVVALVGSPFRDFYPRPVSPEWMRTAAPAVGTWAVGDIVYNSTPSAGSPAGWRCTVAGTPGTWEPIAPSLATAQTWALAQTFTLGGLITTTAAASSPTSFFGLNAANNLYIDTANGPTLTSTANVLTLIDNDNSSTAAFWGVAKDASNSAGATSVARIYEDGRMNLAQSGSRLAIGAAGDPTDALEVTGNVKLTTAGNGIKIKTGSNATMGRATLVAGTVTVATTKASATANVILTTQVPGGTLGEKIIASRVNGTSFTIEARDGTGLLQTLDTSTVAWVIFEEAP